MRTIALTPFIALIVISFSSGGAVGQSAPPKPTIAPPDISDTPHRIRDAEQYRRVCEDMRATRRTPLIPASDLFFLRAIDEYCAFGEFIASGADDKGQCKTKERLSRPHLAFLRQLSLVRHQPAHRIILECLTVSGSLEFRNLDASLIRLNEVDAESVVLIHTKLSGLVIDNSRLRNGLGLLNVTSNGPFQIQKKTEIAANARWQAALFISGSSIHSISVNDAKIQGNIDARNLTNQGEVSFTSEALVDGYLDLRNAAIGGTLTISDSVVKGGVWLTSVSADEVSIRHATLGKRLHARYARIAKTTLFATSTIDGDFDAVGARFGAGLLVGEGTTFLGTATLEHITADRIRIHNSTFEKAVRLNHANIAKEVLLDGGSTLKDSLYATRVQANAIEIDSATIRNFFSAEYAKLGSLVMRNSVVAAPDCEGSTCHISLFNAEIDYVRARNVAIRSWSADNTRMRILLLSGSTTIGYFRCGDCLIEQFALVGARFTRAAIFAGAEIKGTLAFREEDSSVRWGANAHLNLAELRADTIAANACDLVVEQQPQASPDTEPLKCAHQKPGSRKFVPTNLTGTRYRSIVPGRSGLSDQPANLTQRAHNQSSWEDTPLLDLPSSALIRFLRSASTGQYNPQPYEQLASALSAVGKNNEAIDIRVARINERLANPDSRPNVFVRIGYSIYYWVSRYGFQNWQAFLYFVVLIGLGSAFKLMDQHLILKRLYRKRDYDTIVGLWLYSVWFSLDRAMPPLHLDPDARDRRMLADRRLHPLVRHWFYGHRIMGTVLISFFAAGLAGIGH